MPKNPPKSMVTGWDNIHTNIMNNNSHTDEVDKWVYCGFAIRSHIDCNTEIKQGARIKTLSWGKRCVIIAGYIFGCKDVTKQLSYPGMDQAKSCFFKVLYAFRVSLLLGGFPKRNHTISQMDPVYLLPSPPCPWAILFPPLWGVGKKMVNSVTRK